MSQASPVGSLTLECKINYIRGVSEGEIVARARVVNAGRKVHVLEAQTHSCWHGPGHVRRGLKGIASSI